MPETLQTLLQQKDKTKLFVGIGNLLKSDDGVGVYISSGIRSSQSVNSLTVEVSIENYIGKINSLNPDILVLIDCLNMKADPGTYRIFNVSDLEDLTFNTHNISLNRIADFFRMSVYILGIQPEKVSFGENLSYLVKQQADNIINIINS